MLVLVNDEGDIKNSDHHELTMKEMSSTSEFVINKRVSAYTKHTSF